MGNGGGRERSAARLVSCGAAPASYRGKADGDTGRRADGDRRRCRRTRPLPPTILTVVDGELRVEKRCHTVLATRHGGAREESVGDDQFAAADGVADVPVRGRVTPLAHAVERAPGIVRIEVVLAAVGVSVIRHRAAVCRDGHPEVNAHVFRRATAKEEPGSDGSTRWSEDASATQRRTPGPLQAAIRLQYIAHGSGMPGTKGVRCFWGVAPYRQG